MRVVVDVVVRLARGIPGVEKIQRSEDVRLDGNDAHEEQRHVGLEKDAAKQNCRYRARSPYRIVPDIVLMLVQRSKRRYDNACQIEKDITEYRELQPCFESHQPESAFDGSAKGEKYQHVDDQVRPVGMKEAVRDDPVPFLPVEGLIRIEQQPIEQRPVGERCHRYY